MKSVLLLVTALVAPTALAAPPVLEVWWSEQTSARAFLANGTTLCAGEGPASLVVEREMEAATFTLALAACAPVLAFRAILDVEGWRFTDPAGLASGGFFPAEDGSSWQLAALVDNCPNFMICEFTSGIRVQGGFERIG